MQSFLTYEEKLRGIKNVELRKLLYVSSPEVRNTRLINEYKMN